jgi:transitional endoplasmic reticulum ATPase
MTSVSARAFAVPPVDVGSARCHMGVKQLVQLKLSLSDAVRVRFAQDSEALCRAWVAETRGAQYFQVDTFIARNRRAIAFDDVATVVAVPATMVFDAVNLVLKIDANRDESVVNLDELQSVLLGKFVALGFSIGSDRVSVMRVDAFPRSTPSDAVFRIVQSTSLRIDVASAIDSRIDIRPSPGVAPAAPAVPAAVEEFVGLHETRNALLELFRMRLEHVDAFRRLGIEPPRGILVRGVAGSGKELLVRSVARECNAFVQYVNSSDILGTYAGESEERLRDAFASADARAARGDAVVLVLDRIETICAVRKSGGGASNRIVAQLLTLLDSASSSAALESGAVTVVALTSQADRLDPALRRPGRLDREIDVGVPSVADRREILAAKTRELRLADDVDLGLVAQQCVGFVGADLAALCREAAFGALRGARVSVGSADFASALRVVVPTLKRSTTVDVNKSVTWDSIAGVGDVKQTLREAVEWPLVHADAFRTFGIGAPRGILLYGPPGCSKTMLANACANATHCSFVSLDGAAIYSPYLGDAEAALREAFHTARQTTPAIVFLDEVDALVGARSMGSGHDAGDRVQQRVLSTLLNEMDGVSGADGVLVIGATNRADLLDAALMRPGRFDRCVYVPPPDATARRAILELYAKRSPLASDVDFAALADRTVGYTGADLSALCREAAMCVLRASGSVPVPQPIAQVHFDAALRVVRPSLSSAQIARFSTTALARER